jgi:hypothetical protein
MKYVKVSLILECDGQPIFDDLVDEIVEWMMKNNLRGSVGLQPITDDDLTPAAVIAEHLDAIRVELVGIWREWVRKLGRVSCNAGENL